MAAEGHGRQIQLPFSKAVEISIKSIRIRLWRSVITAAGIFLGIAFFSSVRMSAVFNDIQKGIVESKKAEMARGVKLSQDDLRLISASAADQKEEQAAKTRLTWLSYMALIVCTVGIANSMLMSVTERFKEIGTMKCLGALDGFIIKLFFIESCLLGFLASALGCVAGILVISLLHLITDGLSVFGGPFFTGAVRLGGFAVIAGTVLTFAATMVPALRAAKIPPAAALRVEI